MNIIGTGLSGMIGSRIAQVLGPAYRMENLSLETGVDITDKKDITQRILRSHAPWVFHFAAFTDVDAAELQRQDGENGAVWQVNVEATKTIATACRESGKSLLYISTDFVFDGTHDHYTEEDSPHPINWYARTKWEGEKHVAKLERGLIIRISFPYGPAVAQKPDFVSRIVAKLKAGDTIQAPSDQLIVPTFIDDIAVAIEKLVKGDASGMYHVVGSQSLTPFTAAGKIAIHFGFDESRVKSISFEAYYRGRAPRPFHAVLANDKISKFGAFMSTFDEGLAKITVI